MGATALESNYLSDRSVDEETLFRDIHKHILRQAKSGGRIDTEAEIAERFNVTRYKFEKRSLFSRRWALLTVLPNAT